MAKKILSREELVQLAQEQIQFLVKSCNDFDGGYFVEAKRMASTLRLLLHDTRNSKSLLGQLGLKTDFFDTTMQILSEEEIIPTQTSELSLVSSLYGNPIHTYKPNFSNNNNHIKIQFSIWWEQTVIKIIAGKEFSRSKIILSMADQDGGAHVDPALEEDYYDLTRCNSLQHFSINVDASGGLPSEIDISQLQQMSSPLVVYYTIRQIAHEVLISKINPEKNSPKLDTIYPYDEKLYNGVSIGKIGLY